MSGVLVQCGIFSRSCFCGGLVGKIKQTEATESVTSIDGNSKCNLSSTLPLTIAKH